MILKLLKASQEHPGKSVDVMETLAKCISDCMFNKNVINGGLSKPMNSLSAHMHVIIVL